jgi:hypothetical protein
LAVFWYNKGAKHRLAVGNVGGARSTIILDIDAASAQAEPSGQWLSQAAAEGREEKTRFFAGYAAQNDRFLTENRKPAFIPSGSLGTRKTDM